MKNKHKIIIVLSVLMVAIAAAFVYYTNRQASPQIPTNAPVEELTTDEKLLELNKQLIGEEQAEIEAFLKEQPYAMTKSEDGYYYHIIEPGGGRKVRKNDRVCLDYSLELLDGKLCGSSDDGGKKCFIAGRREVEKGLDEAVCLLSHGSEAAVLLPSYLAHGVNGDGGCIGPYTPVLYVIKVVSID